MYSRKINNVELGLNQTDTGFGHRRGPQHAGELHVQVNDKGVDTCEVWTVALVSNTVCEGKRR